MRALQNKSRMRYIAHNPTSHLIVALQKQCKRNKRKRRGLC